MEITLNGESRQVPDHSTASQLVETLCLAGKRMAMEINEEIVPRSTFDERVIRDGDKIEIVGAIGGG
ncbi:MAG TPA: sulfur carrier protein ThiS [Gammaproteobacteria bacterium]|nr:sulfur carrier protein ThiS [Gammaproteobacteria bacterium]